MEAAAQADLSLFFYENETERSLGMALDEAADFGSVALVIGPEGGFADEELRLAPELGLLPVTLGKRILRAETAPVAALANVLFWLGE